MNYRTINNIRCFSPTSREELIHFAFEKKAILVAINAEKILHTTPEMRTVINAGIGYPDGIGAVWALRKKGFKQVQKIPGCELWLDIIEKYHTNKRFYLVGGTDEVINETIKRLKTRYPAIDIVNHRNGYLSSEEERQALISDIAQLQPDVVFVAMGSPKQELLMEEMQRAHKAVYQGLGGSFDVFTNTVKRAPDWWVRNNLEWSYRLVKQPSRITRQIHLVRFFLLLQLNRL